MSSENPLAVEPAMPARHPLADVPDNNPYARMLAIAMDSGADIEKLEKLLAMQERWEGKQAEKAFIHALAAMKAQIPLEVFKTKQVDIKGGAKFKHAELADVVDASVAAMGKFGFAHRWGVRQEDGAIIVTCIITHEQGHSESVELRAAPDTGPGRNSIQAIASTITYLERYTLMASLGVAAKNQDDDGKGGGKPPVDAPEGYDKWQADMLGKADEGSAALQKAWKDSSDVMRRHTIKNEDDWWTTTKRRSVKADQQVSQ